MAFSVMASRAVHAHNRASEQVRERLEKQLQRNAKELGYELKPIVHEIVMPDGEMLTVKPDGEIVNA